MALYEVAVRMEIIEAFLVDASSEAEAKHLAECKASAYCNDVQNVCAETVVEMKE